MNAFALTILRYRDLPIDVARHLSAGIFDTFLVGVLLLIGALIGRGWLHLDYPKVYDYDGDPAFDPHRAALYRRYPEIAAYVATIRLDPRYPSDPECVLPSVAIEPEEIHLTWCTHSATWARRDFAGVERLEFVDEDGLDWTQIDPRGFRMVSS